MLTLQIAVGIWLGGLFLIGTLMAFMRVSGKIERNRRYGVPWWSGLSARVR